jgi:hypothetical protein
MNDPKSILEWKFRIEKISKAAMANPRPSKVFSAALSLPQKLAREKLSKNFSLFCINPVLDFILVGQRCSKVFLEKSAHSGSFL